MAAQVALPYGSRLTGNPTSCETWKPQLDAPEWAAMGCVGTAKRCSSKCARAHLDSAKKASL